MTTLVALCCLMLVYTCVQANYAINDFPTSYEIESFEETWGEIHGNNLEKMGSCKCHAGSCYCCASHKLKVGWKKFEPTACFTIKHDNGNDFYFELKAGMNKKHTKKIVGEKIHLKDHFNKCFNAKIAKMCVEVSDIDIAAKRMCVKLTGTINLIVKKFHFNWKFGCFTIPMREDEMMPILEEE